MAPQEPRREPTADLRADLERHGIDASELSDAEVAEVEEVAGANPDPVTRRESIEQELDEIRASDASVPTRRHPILRAWTRLKGAFMRPISDAAGDRRAEASAALEAHTGREPRDEQLDAAEHEIRRRHGDIEE